MLEVKRLRLLVELSRRGTIAAVAEALSYSPSAVSQQLAVLEKEVGARLLEPAGRRVRLSPEAEVLLQHARIVLAELERAETSLEAARQGIGGIVRLAVFQSAALALVPDALISLAGSHPDLRVEVTQLEPELSLPSLVAGNFDVVVAEEYPGHPLPRLVDLDREELLTDTLQLAAPASWPTTPLAGLASRPFVMEPDGTTARAWSTATCRSAGFEPDVQYTTSDLQMHLRLVESGLAASLVPDLAGALGRTRVRVTELPHRPVRHVFTATRQGARSRPATNAAVTALRHGRSARP